MALAPTEQLLIKQFRDSPATLQEAALRVLLGGLPSPTPAAPKYTVDFGHATINQAAAGDIVNKKGAARPNKKH